MTVDEIVEGIKRELCTSLEEESSRAKKGRAEALRGMCG